jgi:dienelactone hydrolase
MQAQWNPEELLNGLRTRRFVITYAARSVPGVFWAAPDTDRAAPLVLIGHGGSQHKEGAEVLALASSLGRDFGCAVAAVDGPVHGARRVNPAEDKATVRAEFLRMWAQDNHVGEMTGDWQAAIDVLAALPEVDASAIGWCGVSMGTAYGLPVCAADQRIRAAVLGLWSHRYPNSGELLSLATRMTCPVMFHQRWDDELFDRQGQYEVFEALASADKRLCVYPGKHGGLTGEQAEDAVRFLHRRLSETQTNQTQRRQT